MRETRTVDRTDLQNAMAGTKASHERLLGTLDGFRDDQVAEPSLLPGWSRGHLLTHIARNADSHVRMLGGAAEGKRLEQYVGGAGGRAAAIEEGAARAAQELVNDIKSTAAALFHTWETMPDEAWDQEVVAIHGGQPAWVCVLSRWRETEMHHSDLDLGYEWTEWPQHFVAANLPVVTGTLDSRLPAGVRLELSATDSGYETSAGRGNRVTVRGPEAALLAWVSGRSDADLAVDGNALPDLGSWM
jgi:maleylpyruvate isomerase